MVWLPDVAFKSEKCQIPKSAEQPSNDFWQHFHLFQFYLKKPHLVAKPCIRTKRENHYVSLLDESYFEQIFLWPCAEPQRLQK